MHSEEELMSPKLTSFLENLILVISLNQRQVFTRVQFVTLPSPEHIVITLLSS